MRKILKLATVTAFAAGGLLLAAPAAQAAPTHTTETLICGGQSTEINVAGRNGWTADGQHWKAISFRVVGTVTPADGSPSFLVDDNKIWGGGKDQGNPERLQCIQNINETDEQGTFVGNLEVWVIPV